MGNKFNLNVLSYLSYLYILVLSLVELECKKSSTGSFRDQLTPLNYIQLRSELNHGCLGLFGAVTIRRWREAEKERLILICHRSTLQQYASVTFKMALKYSKLREFPCSWVGVDRLSGSIRNRQRKAGVYIVSSNDNILPLCDISPLEGSVYLVWGCVCVCVCVCTRAREPPPPNPPRVLPPPVQRAGFHLSHLGKPNRRTLTLPRSTRKLGLGGGMGEPNPGVPTAALWLGTESFFFSCGEKKNHWVGVSER